jgi:two-component system, NarL family, invasion response regulator UvrY
MRRVLVVDDHAMVRKGLAGILVLQGDGTQMVCDEAGCGEDALKLLKQHQYDLAILDISMPGIGGLELLARIHETLPNLPVLMLSMFPEEQFALRSFKLGASGYLTKKEAADELLLAVKQILDGKRYLSQSLSNSLINQALEGDDTSRPTHAALSNREFQILRGLATGKSLKLLAIDLELSIKTVSTYKARLFSKLHFHSDAELIEYANNHNLRQPCN